MSTSFWALNSVILIFFPFLGGCRYFSEDVLGTGESAGEEGGAAQGEGGVQ